MSSTDRLRLFVGTAVPPEVTHDLLPRANPVLSDPRWRPAPTDQWHVTALFIGDRSADQLDRIIQEVGRIAEATPAIALRDGKLTTMPKEKPYMLWVRFTPEPALTALHHALAAAIGAEPSIYVPYWPHITLARAARSNAPAHQGDMVVDHLTLDRLTLFRSEPGPNGSVHTPLRTWPLNRTGPAGPGVGV